MANKVVLNEIKKSLEGTKGVWIEDLPGVLLSARTTVKGVYGSEVILPVEVGIPSLELPSMNMN